MRLRHCVAATVLFTGLAVPLAGPAMAAPDKDCSDFSTQAEAQAVYDADRSDPNHLDADKDGIACESLGGGSESQVAATPVGGVPAGDGSTATASGDDTLRIVLGGLGVAAAGGAAYAARRTARGRA